MRRFGIVATNDERVETKRKWYEFWKRRESYQWYYVDDLQLEVLIVFLPNLGGWSDARKASWLGRIGEFFEENGISSVVATCRLKEAMPLEIHMGNINIHSGRLFMKKLTPQILNVLSNALGCKNYKCKLAIVDERLSETTQGLVIDLCTKFRYISIVTQNIGKAEALSSKLMDEFGLSLEIESADNALSCDYAIIADGEMPPITGAVAVIDLTDSGHGFAVPTINDVEIKFENEFRLPLQVRDVELAEALFMLGILEDVKINKLHYRGSNREIS